MATPRPVTATVGHHAASRPTVSGYGEVAQQLGAHVTGVPGGAGMAQEALDTAAAASVDALSG